MAASTQSPEFHLFSSLPLELRLQIWRETLPDVNSNTLTLHSYKKGCWGLEQNLGGAGSNESAYAFTSTDLQFNFRHEMLDDVQINVPIVFFVNHEARSAGLTWARQQGVKMHFNKERDCHVFILPFSPLRDALFINTNQWEEFCLEPAELLAQPGLCGQTVISNPEITEVALPHTALSAEVPIFFDLIHWFPRIEVMYVVVDIDLGVTPSDLVSVEARQKAKRRMKHQRWTIGETQGHAFVWNNKERKFAWRTGTSIGDRSMYRQIEETALGMAKIFAQRKVDNFEIQPVLMLRG
jgi:hypothetical protein